MNIQEAPQIQQEQESKKKWYETGYAKTAGIMAGAIVLLFVLSACTGNHDVETTKDALDDLKPGDDAVKRFAEAQRAYAAEHAKVVSLESTNAKLQEQITAQGKEIASIKERLATFKNTVPADRFANVPHENVVGNGGGHYKRIFVNDRLVQVIDPNGNIVFGTQNAGIGSMGQISNGSVMNGPMMSGNFGVRRSGGFFHELGGALIRAIDRTSASIAVGDNAHIYIGGGQHYGFPQQGYPGQYYQPYPAYYPRPHILRPIPQFVPGSAWTH